MQQASLGRRKSLSMLQGSAKQELLPTECAQRQRHRLIGCGWGLPLWGMCNEVDAWDWLKVGSVLQKPHS